MNDIKQVIIVRKDLNMRKGKMVAQGAHASLGAFLEASKTNQEQVSDWFANGQKKICVGCNNEEELESLYTQARKAKLPCYYVIDSGLTEFKGPTATAFAVGPTYSKDIDKITGKLNLL